MKQIKYSILPVIALLSTSGFTQDEDQIQPGSDQWQKIHSVDRAPTPVAIPPSVDLAEAVQIGTSYRGYALGLNLGKITIEAKIADTAFDIHYNVRQKGVARWFNDGTLDSFALGDISANRVNFLYYKYTKFEGDEISEKELVREDPVGRIRLWSDPEISLHHPVAPPLSTYSLDPASGLVQLGYLPAAPGAHPCTRSAKIYDGKRRFDIIMSPDKNMIIKKRRAGKARDQLYAGPAIRCNVTMKRIAGYKQKHLKEKPPAGKIYLVKVPQAFQTEALHYIPVLIEGSFGMRLEARNPILTNSAGETVNLANLSS